MTGPRTFVTDALRWRHADETDLEGIADAYAAMDERRAIKSLVRVGVV